MVSWAELEKSDHAMAEAGRALLYQFGSVGLAFLGTVRKDGVARLHPVCPLLTDDRMYVFVVPSSKRNDLLRDGRCALHSFPCADNEDAFGLTGRVTLVEDHATRQRMAEQFAAERSLLGIEPSHEDDLLFEVSIESCFLTRTTGHGDPHPQHQHWHS